MALTETAAGLYDDYIDDYIEAVAIGALAISNLSTMAPGLNRRVLALGRVELSRHNNQRIAKLSLVLDHCESDEEAIEATRSILGDRAADKLAAQRILIDCPACGHEAPKWAFATWMTKKQEAYAAGFDEEAREAQGYTIALTCPACESYVL